jgi:hypothetical protein
MHHSIVSLAAGPSGFRRTGDKKYNPYKENQRMKNWKTTLSGALSASGAILPLFGVPAEIGQAVSVLGLFLIGLFAKDSNVTGGTISQ